jgi:hypothetical protein
MDKLRILCIRDRDRVSVTVHDMHVYMCEIIHDEHTYAYYQLAKTSSP